MAPAEYLKKPYGRVVVPEADGTFRGEITEFPGCIAVGDTAAEALANLEEVAASWLEGTVARGLRVPEPVDSNGFSGKLVVRLPKTLHKKAAHVAAREGVSLNSFIVSSLAEQVGTRSGSALRIATTGGNYTQNINAFFVSAASPTSSSGAGMALTATTEAKAGLLKDPWGTVHA